MHKRSSPPTSASPRRAKCFAILLSGLFFFPTPMRAALLRACRPTDTPLVCRLQSLLTFLDATAVLLGLLLLISVLAAFRAYRRKAKKLTPDELTSDAR